VTKAAATNGHHGPNQGTTHRRRATSAPDGALPSPPMTASGCPECQPSGAAEAWANRPRLTTVATLVDEPHHILSVVTCRACGQRFVSEFSEEVDWQDGEDPQSWVLLPVSAEEASALLAPGVDATRFDRRVLPPRRFLSVEHPREGPLVARWVEGPAG